MPPSDGVTPLSEPRRSPTVRDFPSSGPFSLGSAGPRFAARAVDLCIVGFPALLYIALTTQFADGAFSFDVPFWVGLATFALGSLYEALFIGSAGRTPGKMLFGLRVVRLIDGGRPDLDRSLLRGMVPWCFVALPIGPFAVPAMLAAFGTVTGEFHRGLADHATGTIVISTR